MSSKIFLFMDNVAGSCTDSNHLGWIQIYNVDFEIDRHVEFKPHTASLAPINKYPTISKIVITKPHCTASPQLFANCYTLQRSRIMIDIVNEKHGNNGLVNTILDSGSTRFEFNVGYVSKIKLNGLTNSLERLELTVSSMSVTYNPPSDSHELDKKSSSGYHFQNYKPL